MQEQFVALNPYETDQYFIVLANGKVHWRIPSASSSTVRDVIRKTNLLLNIQDQMIDMHLELLELD